MVELQQQPLGEGLPRSVDASVVENFGVFAADAHSVGGAAVQVGALALLPLQGHPTERRAACGRRQRTENTIKKGFTCGQKSVIRKHGWWIWLIFTTIYKVTGSKGSKVAFLTVHAGEVGFSQHGGDPQLLRVDVGPHQVVTGRHLHHCFQLAAHSVPLRTHKTKVRL